MLLPVPLLPQPVLLLPCCVFGRNRLQLLPGGPSGPQHPVPEQLLLAWLRDWKLAVRRCCFSCGWGSGCSGVLPVVQLLAAACCCEAFHLQRKRHTTAHSLLSAHICATG